MARFKYEKYFFDEELKVCTKRGIEGVMELSEDTVKKNIAFIASQLGFMECRVSEAKKASHAALYEEWVEKEHYGEMEWMARGVSRRVNPCEVLEGAKSVVSLALNYYSEENEGKEYKIARYARNEDYHSIIEEKLKELNEAMEQMGGAQRYYVDTGPVLERDFASDSGLGWNGKSTLQVHPKHGTYFFLAEIITTLKMTPDEALKDHCGSCRRCMDACPTQAIVKERSVDATRCISYFTIEHSGSIPEEFRRSIGDRLYGCDICMEVCPWNRFAKVSRETRLHARQELHQYELRDFLNMGEEEFRSVFARSPIKRIKRERFLRNVCVVMGNKGEGQSDVKLLEELMEREKSALIHEHARWAIQEIRLRSKEG